MAESIQHTATVPPQCSEQRFDQVAAHLFPDYSRSRLQSWIKAGALTADGKTLRPRDSVVEGQVLQLEAQVEDDERWLPEDIALDIVYEDDDILVLNKPAGLVVHPAAGHGDGTLVNALLNHYPDIASVPRAGVVHRLDKDTTGLMVVAKNLAAHNDLVSQLQARTVSREYVAICCGVLTGGGKVDAPIGRHARHRQKMAVLEFGGKEAITHYRVVQRFFAHTLVRCKLETGRTHQIRVHMAYRHYPLVGDTLYAGRPKLPKGADDALIDLLRSFPRQALHAQRLGLIHPASGEFMAWEVEIPTDMTELIRVLDEDTKRRATI
jgi:23S rRNA pseudouridine1911/1915/1917 synthase